MKKHYCTVLKTVAVLFAVIIAASLASSCKRPAGEAPDVPHELITDAVIVGPTKEVTVTAEETPAATQTAEPANNVSETPSGIPADTGTPEPSDTPSPEPTDTPSPVPTPEPTPTATPTPAPTQTPAPTATPTVAPTPTPAPTPLNVNFTVANVFSDNMVIQRGEPVRIWGFADSGTDGNVIRGEFMGETAETMISNGEWLLEFSRSFEACTDTGNHIRVSSVTKETVIRDVLIGDVYFVAGQSNCAYNMSNYWVFVDNQDTARCSRYANYDLPIRINYNTQTVPNTSVKRGSGEEAKDLTRTNTWQIATRSNIANFSAIGYLFARNYVLMTGGTVPVGLIEIDGNGRPLGSFVCNSTAVKFRTDAYDFFKGYYVTTGLNGDHGRFLYNEYMAPFARMPIAGMLWYQGESDCLINEANRYAAVFVDFIEYMRGTHNVNSRDFPVYFVEFPSMYTQPEGYTDTWAYLDVGRIRGKMGNMVTMTPNMFQIQSSDLWPDKTYWNSLHPNCKFEQAMRAARIACAYKSEGSVTMDTASGPIVESVTFSADGLTATVKYKNVGEGLKTVDGSDTVRGFSAVTSSGAVSVPLTGTIEGTDTVVITSSDALYGVAYNVVTTYFFGDELNLCNSAGIPAGAFMISG